MEWVTEAGAGTREFKVVHGTGLIDGVGKEHTTGWYIPDMRVKQSASDVLQVKGCATTHLLVQRKRN